MEGRSQTVMDKLAALDCNQIQVAPQPTTEKMQVDLYNYQLGSRSDGNSIFEASMQFKNCS